MKEAKIIIGGAFGDEGKGLFTDYLAAKSEERACVVRFNGGAQAGHTVEMADGRRHVFSHFGSGSFAGLPTFLSSFFVCNPIVFLRERSELLKKDVNPEVHADTACAVTTPYDIMINQIAEIARGSARHGSVGVGFGETLARQESGVYALYLDDLRDIGGLRAKLDAIRGIWAYKRLAALGVKEIGGEWLERLRSEAIRERFIEDAHAFATLVMPASRNFGARWKSLIFEGAQGLLLDQNRGWFPHVTRSNTGIRNALALAKMWGIEALDVYYLTRSYTTRHGAGPLPNELGRLPYAGIVDKTNKPNPYQGSLRFAWLNADLFRDTVLRDLTDGKGWARLRPHLAMSCVDQIEGEARFVVNGVLRTASIMEMYDFIREEIGASSGLASFGPTRATIEAVAARPAARPRASIADIGNGLFKAFEIMQNDVAAAQA